MKGLGVLLLGLLAVVGFFCLIAWMASHNPNATHTALASNTPSKISPAELQSIIADSYHVESSRFIEPDILWVTVPNGTDPQRVCEGIANLWAHRSGWDYVCVESWVGNVRLARAKVQYGKLGY